MGSKSLFEVMLFTAMFLILLNAAISKQCSVHKKVYLTPPFTMEPGEVHNRYYTIDFPKGHIGIKNFDGEVVDTLGNPVPISQLYVHHWVIYRYFVNISEDIQPRQSNPSPTSILFQGNVDPCNSGSLFGFGSETRKSNYKLPGPYVTEVGDPKQTIPVGYKHAWYANLHVIHTDGTEDPIRCSECLCSLYNGTNGHGTDGQLLPDGYVGGLRCCDEGARCRLKADQPAPQRKTFFFRYTVEWVEWSEDCDFVAVRGYILDLSGCEFEHTVPQCENPGSADCTYVLEKNIRIPHAGEIVTGLGHLHIAGQDISVSKEDGTPFCLVTGIHGNGSKLEAGNESGYLVGMTPCHPQPGSVKVRTNETLNFISKYDSHVQHTGTMSTIVLYVVESRDDDHETV